MTDNAGCKNKMHTEIDAATSGVKCDAMTIDFTQFPGGLKWRSEN